MEQSENAMIPLQSEMVVFLQEWGFTNPEKILKKQPDIIQEEYSVLTQRITTLRREGYDPLKIITKWPRALCLDYWQRIKPKVTAL
ncbi:MAG: hypothetical protein ABFQ53_02065, partial [Patescibacteria group bacterium]